MKKPDKYIDLYNGRIRYFLKSNNGHVRSEAKSELQEILIDLGFERNMQFLIFPTNNWTLDDTVYLEIQSGIEKCPGSQKYGIKPYKCGRIAVEVTGQYVEHPKITTIIEKLNGWKDKYMQMDSTN